jgi:hypothetical protein
VSSVNTFAELEVLAKVDQDIYNILSNTNYGRLTAKAELIHTKNLIVSEKLIRTWREKHKSIQHELADTAINNILNSHQHTTSIYSSKLTTTLKAKTKDQRVIAFGDFQINKHDPVFLAKTVQFVRDQQPDMICLTGDESDNSAVGRWAKGMKEEYESNLQAQIDETVQWLTMIREAAPNATIHMAHSNHMHWITRAVETRLPGLATLRALTPEVMYELDSLEINYQHKVFEFLPDYLLGHGHQWELTSKTHTVKGTEHVMRTGKSILAGHVHQAALRPVFIGYEGKGTQHVYVNAGCIMDFEKAMESNGGYVKGTSPNWSKGIVVITREAGQNYTELILGQNNGTFRYEGRIY